jgi:hypothetical protein
MARSRPRSKRWIQHVRETSDAMDLPPGIFTRSPRAIARGLKSAVLRSTRTRGTKFQSAMSMLNLYINRSGRTLTSRDRTRLAAARRELRRLFRRANGPGASRSLSRSRPKKRAA